MKSNVERLYSSIPGVNAMANRLQHFGGQHQQNRMILDKRRALDKAVLYSYQGAWVQKEDGSSLTKALINPNKLKQDYDDKIISVGFEHNYKVGDVFEWMGTKTHWLIYLQDMTELAYFRGDIRRCSYEISWVDEEGREHSTYAAIRGPVETKIDYIQKHGISVDNPNYTLNILLPKSNEVLDYFKRYTKFYLNGEEVCWRVAAIDWISTPGILEVNAIEYYANETEDDIENGIVGGLKVQPQDPNPIDNEIEGDTFIKIKKEYEYTFAGDTDGSWNTTPKAPVVLRIDEEDPRKVYLKWDSAYSGQFDLFYGTNKKTIVVESLF